MFSVRLATAGMFLLIPAALLHAQSVADVDKGKQLFLGMCSRCHGIQGGGGEGPNLNRPILTHAADDQALRAIIRDGIPNTGMPRVRRMTDAELNALVAYVRSLGRVAATSIAGNIENGKAVYARLGCGSCHTIAGRGGSFGPELTNIAALRAPEYLRQAIIDPAAALPRGVLLVPGRGFNEYLPVRVVTRDGQEIHGIRVNEDSFTIQIKDSSDRLYSFRKSDLQSLDKQIGTSMMPSYRDKVSESDINDVVAFLWTLRGEK